jgi:copper chaperone NosL
MKKILIWLVLLVMVSAACGSQANLETPPEIRYGEDICDRCNMIINEARFAASYVTSTGDVRRFDDIGEMVAYVQEVPEEVIVYWVHDYETEKWVKADEAVYIAADGLRTPMGFDIVAFAAQEKAEALAAETGGEIHTFEELMDMEMAQED